MSQSERGRRFLANPRAFSVPGAEGGGESLPEEGQGKRRLRSPGRKSGGAGTRSATAAERLGGPALTCDVTCSDWLYFL